MSMTIEYERLFQQWHKEEQEKIVGYYVKHSLSTIKDRLNALRRYFDFSAYFESDADDIDDDMLEARELHSLEGSLLRELP